MKNIAVAAFAAALLGFCSASASAMTVAQLKDLMEKEGLVGEISAASYVRGLLDGMKEKNASAAVSVSFGACTTAVPSTDPDVSGMISKWRKSGRPMDVPASAMVSSSMEETMKCSGQVASGTATAIR